MPCPKNLFRGGKGRKAGGGGGGGEEIKILF